MNIDSPKTCRILGISFFAVLTVIEVVMFCHIFNALDTSWIKVGAIGLSTAVFNTALWFFAEAYHQTLLNVKNNK